VTGGTVQKRDTIQESLVGISVQSYISLCVPPVLPTRDFFGQKEIK